MCTIPEELSKEALLHRIRGFAETPRDIIVFTVNEIRFVAVSFFTENENVLQYSVRVFYDFTFHELVHIQNFTPNEAVLTMGFVNFKRKLMEPHDFLAIGTGVVEDTEPRGRLLLFEINGTMFIPHPFRFISGLPGPVSAIQAVDGYLIAAILFEVKVFTYVEDEQPRLEPIAFYLGPYITNQIDIMHNNLLCGDAFRSIFCLNFQEQHNERDLRLLGQSLRRT